MRKLANLLGVLALGLIAAQSHGLQLQSTLTTQDLGDAQYFDRFGTSVSISGNVAVVGVPNDDVGSFESYGSVYVFRRIAGIWNLEQKLVSGSNMGSGRFGTSVDVDGDTIAVGAPIAGRVYVFDYANDGWNLSAELSSSSPAANDRFGSKVAIRGNLVVASAPFFDSPGVSDSGAVDVFLRQSGIWTHQTRLLAPQSATDDLFGARLDVSNDTIAASIQRTGSFGGEVLVFTFVQGAWSHTQTIHASDGSPGNGFGTALSIDGDNLAIGAPNAPATVGAAYVFSRSGGVWTESQKLGSAIGNSGDRFGASVSIHGDRLLAGSPTSSGNMGAVRPYQKVLGSWVPEPLIERIGRVAGDRFGQVLAINNGTAIVGVPSGEPKGLLGDTGVVDLFEWQSLVAPPVQVDELSAGVPNGGVRRLGAAVSAEGDVAVLGAPDELGQNGSYGAGAAYVFRRSGAGWSLLQRLAPDNGSEQFGYSVAVDGDVVAVGDPGNDGVGLFDSGAVHIFELTNGVYAKTLEIRADDAEDADYFGSALAFGNGMLVVGAPLKDTGGSFNAGAAYIFDRANDWSLSSKLLSSLPQAGASFGTALTVSNELIAVSAPGDLGLSVSGRVELFERQNGGWVNFQSIAGLIVGDNFGNAIAISGDRLLVGANTAAVAGNQSQGRVDIFGESSSGAWLAHGSIHAPDGTSGDLFGTCLQASEHAIVVGAPGATGSTGSFYVFNPEALSDSPEITTSAGLSGTSRELGQACAMAKTTLLVGAPSRDGELPFGNPYEGGAYVFDVPRRNVFADDFEGQ